MDYQFEITRLSGPVVVLGIFIPALLFSLIYTHYLRIAFVRGLALSVVTALAAISSIVVTKGSVLRPAGHSPDDVAMAGLAWIVMVLVGVGIVGRLYRAWILDLATEAEREPNGRGVRAWLGVANLIMGGAFVVTAYLARQWDPVGTATALAGLFLAYPSANCVMKSGEATGGREVEELAEERRRVLAMVEAGKISGEDGAELIGALGQSRLVARETGAGARLTGNMRVMMLGAALVVVGFCLPWFSVDLGARMQEAMSNMQQALPAGVSLPPGYTGAVQVPTLARTVLEVRGGEIEHGLGWLILAMAGAVAVIPLVWAARGEQRDRQRAALVVALLVGSVLVMYLVSNGYREMNVGMVLVMAGYGVMWVGVVREYVRPRVGVVAVAG